MVATARVPAGNEWALPHFRQVRALRLAAMGLGLSLSLFLDSVHPGQLLAEPAFIGGVIALCLVTGMTFLPGFKRFQPWMMTTIPLLDIGVIGLFSLIPGAGTGSAIIVIMPAMWLGGTLGRLGILVAAAVSTMCLVAPDLYLHGLYDQGWSEAVSIILFATLAATAMTLSTAIWQKQVLRLEQQEHSLRRAIGVKDDFVALVSHELRTPLTSIMGYLDLVSDCDLPDQVVTHLAAVSRNADRLLLLVTDLLAAHEAEVLPMRLTIETVDVGALAQLSVNDIDTRARAGGLSLERHLPQGILIQADPNRLLQILDNLLSNALKFTPAGGRISVEVRQRATGVDLTITDTGVGMDQVSLQSLGMKFFRAPKTTASAIQGIGLGLTITKSIVEAHNGSLTFGSQEGVGTSVVVHLPTLAPSATSPSDPRLGNPELTTLSGPRT
jgi:signal transduction histidine kinase